MPKLIIPKRTDKGLSVDDYWKIRQQFSKQSIKHVPAYREQQVTNRYRFSHISEQAYNFNPLIYFLTKKIEPDFDKTHTQTYMEEIRYRLPQQIMRIKKLILGLASVLQNMPKILSILWNHLECEDSWRILQALLKDTKSESYELWMEEGLLKIIENLGTTFHETKFRHIFDTLCVFMENCFPKIAENIESLDRFFNRIGQIYLSHPNKYFKKFVLKTVSYILSNIEQQPFQQFINLALKKIQLRNFVSEFLANRLKYSSGCLSPHSLQQFISILNWLHEKKQQHSQKNEIQEDAPQQGQLKNIAQQFIEKVIVNLKDFSESKNADEQTLNLFDLPYIVKALIEMADSGRVDPASVILPLDYYINEHHQITTRNKKMMRKYRTNISIQLKRIIFKFTWEHLEQIERDMRIYRMLAASFCEQLTSLDTIKNFLKKQEDDENILNFLELLQASQISTENAKILIFGLCNRFESFLTNVNLCVPEKILQIVYRCTILAKNKGFSIKLEAIFKKENHHAIKNKIDVFCHSCAEVFKTSEQHFFQVYSHLLVFLRLCSILQFSNQLISTISPSLAQLFDIVMNPFKQMISSQLGDQENSTRIYNISNYKQQILIHHHQSVPLMIRCLTLLQSFLQLQNKKNFQIIKQIPKIFQQIFINKYSLLALHSESLFKEKNRIRYDNLYNMLQARDRQVRLFAIKWMKDEKSDCNFSHEKYQKILEYIYEIDSDIVDLETEREVKRLFLELERELPNLEQNSEQMKSILVCWSLGFAYTGFNLIENNFVNFFKELLEKCAKCETVTNTVMQYLEIQTLKSSRIYQQEIKKLFPANTQDEDIYLQGPIYQLIKKDFKITANQTMENIGINRIAKTIGFSEKIKNNLGLRLISLLDQYFSEEFSREKNTIRKLAEGQEQFDQDFHKNRLLPPKTSFLESVILKLPSSQYLPPLECLHYTKLPYLHLSAVTKIKKQGWQLNWTKAANNKTKKNHEKEILGITIDFERMSYDEKRIYIHFLFGELLKANASKLKMIIQYVRDYLPDLVPYFFKILINDCLLSGVYQLYHLQKSSFDVQNDKLVQNVFRFIDSRKLLSYFYIVKGAIKCLAHYLREGLSKHIFYLLTQLLEIVNNQQQSNQDDDEQAEELEEQNDENNEEQENEQEIEEVNDKDKEQRQYKNHRKQLYKILTLIFHQLSDSIPIEQLDEILSIFARQNKISTLANAAVHSVPGVMNFIKEVSSNWRYSQSLLKFNILQNLSEVFKKCVQLEMSSSGRSSVIVCTDIFCNLLGIHDQSYIMDQEQSETIERNRKAIRLHHKNLLSNILDYLVSTALINSNNSRQNASNNKIISHLIVRILKICEVISQIYAEQMIELDERWQNYLVKQLQKIVNKNKSLTEKLKEKLESILKIMMNYIYYQLSAKQMPSMREQSQFKASEPLLLKLIYLLPQIKQITHRKIIIDAVHKYSLLASKNIPISRQVSEIAQMLTSIVPNSLEQQLDFVSFFKGVSEYKLQISNLTIRQHEYILYCLSAYICHEQFSVRKAISSLIEEFLCNITITQKKIVARLFRNIVDYLKKPMAAQQHIFWSILSTSAHFVRWICKSDPESTVEGYNMFDGYLGSEQNYENDTFQLLCAISQNKKMEGLKKLKSMLIQTTNKFQSKLGFAYPNIISSIILPVLQHLIFPPPPSSHNAQQTSNLSSTLSHISLQVYEIAMKQAGQSHQKKQLKRLITKLKLDTNTVGVSTSTVIKRNILVIKIIAKIIEAIDLPNCTHSIKSMIKESGFDEFHKKIVEKESRFTNIREQDNNEDEDEEQAIKKKAFNGINHDIDDEEMINMNFLNFDKKLMQIQEDEAEQDDNENQENQNQEKKASIIRFLKLNILSPLKTLLMFENKSEKNNEEENDKSRMYLSIVVTKIIMKFPMDVFLIELQKVLSKLGRLLKKKKYEVRQNSRKCLAEISKLVGPELLYMIIRELKFHLRDNFQNHVLNYTIYYILEKISSSQKNTTAINLTHISNGSIDHILPLLLPPIIDQIFGLQSQQKEQVDENLIPTINMQSKKKKGYELLGILCKHISIDKIEYLIKYFEKFLKEYMNTEANLMKYEEMLNSAIFSGLAKNQAIISSNRSIMNTFINLLHHSIQQLKSQIKIYKFSTNSQAAHESTVRQPSKYKVKKTGLKQTYQLQEEAGRNTSIFKKQQKVLREQRNREILINSLLQFYLGMLIMLIRKKVINKESFEESGEMEEEMVEKEHFNSMISFVVECLDHRDNRLLNKALKIIHHVINWNNIGAETVDVTDKTKSTGNKKLLKKICRKIFTLIQKLTHSDEELLKECFTLLNDVLSQVSITTDLLPTIMTIIKLHIESSEQTIIEQPYKLFRTVLYKISNTPLIFEQSIKEMYEFVRITMISTSLDNIRAVCRLICLTYMKQMDLDIAGKKSQHMGIGFKDEVSFYLNNLDCKYTESQLCILDVIEQALSNRDKKDIEQTGEIIIMSLGTAFANDKQNSEKMKKIIHLIASKIDKSKTIKLIDKSLIWAANQTNKLIPICGFFLLQTLLSTPQLNYKPTNQQIHQILEIATIILEHQEEKVDLYYDNIRAQKEKKQAIKHNPEWAEIIKEGDYDDNYIDVEERMNGMLEVLGWMVDNNIVGTGKKLNKEVKDQQNRVISMLWKLFSAPGQALFLKLSPLLLKIKNLSIFIGDSLLSSEKEEQCSLRTKFLQLSKNIHQQHSSLIGQIALKIVSQLVISPVTIKYISGIVSLLLTRINKSILSLKKNESGMKVCIQLCVILMNFNQDVRQQIVSNEAVRDQILRTIAKVTRNQLIPSSIKQSMQQLSELIKHELGQSDFYRRIANIESQRKQKKMEQKVKLSRLAVTDQQEYYEQLRGKKKHKKH